MFVALESFSLTPLASAAEFKHQLRLRKKL